jgi:NitT/TauT family transport system substrate-binding protein
LEVSVSTRPRRLPTALAPVLALAVVVTGCGSSAKADSSSGSGRESVTLRLGYFPNVTHAPAIIGMQGDKFADELGSGVKLEQQTFNAGSDVVTALLAGTLDASFVGPNPAINGYQKTDKGIRIVAGTASGGASLVVKPSITSAADLKGKKIATPQLGNTQDVALRSWLKQNGLETDTSGGGDVHVVPQENSVTLTSFQSGDIDGAWVPEPWATRLVQEGGGKVLVDEATLWPKGQFVTTQLIVTTKFLDAHPDVVQNLIAGLSDSITLIRTNPAEAQDLVSKGIEAVTGKALSPAVIAASFKKLDFTLDPIASSLAKDAQSALELGFLKSADIAGIYDLSLVNKVLTANGRHQIANP